MCIGRLLMSRRDMLRGLALTGSAGIAALIAGGDSAAALNSSTEGDLSILLAALYLEHEAVEAYETGALTGLLLIDILNVGIAFQSDHKYHRDGIIKTIESLGGTPIKAEEKYSFGQLKTVSDILKLAHKLEQGAVDAYSTLASNIQNRA